MNVFVIARRPLWLPSTLALSREYRSRSSDGPPNEKAKATEAEVIDAAEWQ